MSTVGTSPEAATAAQTLALKEWGAVVHALLDGRQTLLLRKGGIHEKRFAVGADGQARFVIFPTVAHSHAERVRAEHTDVLDRGWADVSDSALTVRCGVELVAAVPVARPEALGEVADLHIWTDESVRRDRLEFRPRQQLQALLVRAYALGAPVVLPRAEEYGGCRSWLHLPLSWPEGSGHAVHDAERLAADVQRVRESLA